MKKLLGIIVVVAMISTLAISASAATTLTLDIKDTEFVYHEVAGAEAKAAGKQIDHELIRKIKYTFTITDYDCSADPDDPCSGKCVAVSYNSNATKFKKEDFCYADKKTVEVDLAGAGWPQKKGDDIDDYLQIGAAFWALEAGMTAKCDVEIIGENGATLVLGQQYTAPGATTTAAGGSGTTAAVNSGDKLNTGIEGVLLLGGVAVLATGAVVISRRKK